MPNYLSYFFMLESLQKNRDLDGRYQSNIEKYTFFKNQLRVDTVSLRS